MKKISIILIALFCGMTIKGFSQTTPPAPTPATAPTTAPAPATADFFAAKWEILIAGTPDGDKKMITTLTRKDGKLTGELSDAVDATKEKIAITNIEEEAAKITIYFSASGYDISMPLEKVDDDNLKGQVMGMFDTKAKRVK